MAGWALHLEEPEPDRSLAIVTSQGGSGRRPVTSGRGSLEPYFFSSPHITISRELTTPVMLFRQAFGVRYWPIEMNGITS